MADILRPALGLLPVASFLAVLLLLDSYKLVRLRAVVGVVLAGGRLGVRVGVAVGVAVGVEVVTGAAAITPPRGGRRIPARPQ